MPPQYLPKIPSLNVLAIDDGGVRGLSSLLILRNVMESLNIAHGSDSVFLPWQIFDVICGSSTGGLIAIMLGRLRMSVQDALNHYRARCEEVFGSPRLFGWLRNPGFPTPVYTSSSALKKSIEMIVNPTHRNGEALLNEPMTENSDGIYCHTVVVAITKAQVAAPPELFESYAPEQQHIWESAPAPTATGGCFGPVEIRAGNAPSITYLDADVVANNPSEIACQQVQQLFPGRPIGCFLSLGTGVLDVTPKLKGNLTKRGIACKELAESYETVADRVGNKFRDEYKGSPDPYFRFSVNSGLERIAKWAEASTLTGLTSAYMRFQEQEEALESCVKALKPKADWIIAQRELL